MPIGIFQNTKLDQANSWATKEFLDIRFVFNLPSLRKSPYPHFLTNANFAVEWLRKFMTS